MSSNLIPCLNPDCEDGEIIVFNAYNPDPLKPETEQCAFCNGRGFILSGEPIAVAN